MSAVTSVAGLLVLAGTLADLVATTLAGSLPAGWVTRRLGPMAWAAIRRGATGRHRLLQSAGVLLVLGLVLLWILGLWLGWTLVLWDTAGWTTSQDRAASAVERLYAAGYTLTTLGVGDILPTTALGRVLIVVCSASGLLTLTLAITYLVPVLNAVTARRVLASTLNALGGDPEQVRERLWPAGDLQGTRATVEGLASDIRFVTQAHYSYPVMHFFHSPTPATAFAPALARLALAVESQTERLDGATAPLHLHLLTSAIEEHITVQIESFVTAGPGAEHPRGRLRAIVRDDAWSWDIVEP